MLNQLCFRLFQRFILARYGAWEIEKKDHFVFIDKILCLGSAVDKSLSVPTNYVNVLVETEDIDKSWSNDSIRISFYDTDASEVHFTNEDSQLWTMI